MYKNKLIKLVNPLNQDIWFCKDVMDVHFIEGVPFLKVFKETDPVRIHYMRKDALQVYKKPIIIAK